MRRGALFEVENYWQGILVAFLCLTSHLPIAIAQGGGTNLSETAAWGVVPSPNAGADPGNVLNAVAVVSDTDIWAVGSYGDLVHPKPQVQHWNGEQWSEVALPANTGEGELFGVAAIATDDVWIVGGFNSGGRSLILHWDGTGLRRVPNPNPGTFNRLYAVTAVAADDIWAVGETADGVSRPLIQHWDGARWRIVAAPTSGAGYTKLFGVDALSATDVWAVGSAANRAFALHWDGVRWARVATGGLGGDAALQAVSGLSPDDVWAVGDGADGSLVAHWNGTAWTAVAVPHPGDLFEGLNGVAALASDDAWAVGFADESGAFRTFTMHWDGIAWSLVPSANTDPSFNELKGVAEATPDGVWTVGIGDGTLVERWDGAQWNVVASSNAGIADNALIAVDALGPADIWAAGHAGSDSLIERWDGTRWTIVPSPNLEFGAPLDGIVALAPDDAWAVGSSGSGASLDSIAVAMHWDGSEWAFVETPQPGGVSVDRLWAVDAAAMNDVYAVGEYWDEQVRVRPSILHWNGSRWSRVANGCSPTGALQGVDVFAPDHIWAVGEQTSCRYDGVAWTAVPIDPSGGTDILRDVAILAPDDVWTVGRSVFCFAKHCTTQAYAAHWNGVAWTRVPVPGVTLGGVVALAADDVWAAGTLSIGTVIAHWDGKEWTSVPAPDPGVGGNLNDLTRPSAETLWAVGDFYAADAPRTLIEQAPSTTQGTVVGDTAVSGATVTWIGPVSDTTSTDVFGAYAAAGLPAGQYTFVAASDGCVPALAVVQVIAGTTITQHLRPDC